MAKTLEAASDNKYVRAGSNRVRGDEAKALGDYNQEQGMYPESMKCLEKALRFN